MNALLFIPASLALCSGFIAGCGGSSQSKESFLPVGTARNVIITLEDDTTYPFAFVTTSELYASLYDGASAFNSSCSVHVVNYVPADDHADKISFNWEPNRNGNNVAIPAYVILSDVTNVTKGIGSATCDVRDSYVYIDPPQLGRPGRIIDFQGLTPDPNPAQ